MTTTEGAMARLAAAPCPKCFEGKRLGSDQPRYSPDCDRCDGTGALLLGLREPCPSDGASWHPSKAISCPCGGIGWRPKAPDAVLVLEAMAKAGYAPSIAYGRNHDGEESWLVVLSDFFGEDGTLTTAVLLAADRAVQTYQEARV